jgi:hypothetical protein
MKVFKVKIRQKKFIGENLCQRLRNIMKVFKFLAFKKIAIKVINLEKLFYNKKLGLTGLKVYLLMQLLKMVIKSTG